MSSRQTFVVLVAVLVLGSLATAWLAGGFRRARPVRPIVQMTIPDAATACTLVCLNKSGKTLDALEIKYTGNALLSQMSVGGGSQVSMSNSAQGGQMKMATQINDGERKECFRLVGEGVLDSLTVTVGEHETEHKLEAPLVAGKILVVQVEPEGKVSTQLEEP